MVNHQFFSGFATEDSVDGVKEVIFGLQKIGQ